MFKIKNISSLLLFVLIFSVQSVFAENNTNKPIKITASNYQQEISEGVVIVDFWAPWCKSCRKLSPVLDKIAKDKNLNIKVAKLNVDSYKSFAIEKGIKILPTTIIYKDGKEITRITGTYSKEDILKIIEPIRKTQ